MTEDTHRSSPMDDRLHEARAIVAAAVPGASIPPADCTNRCGMGPCDCSGKWRTVAWALDLPRLRELLSEATG